MVLERESLANKYDNLKGKVAQRESKISAYQKIVDSLDQDLTELDNLVANKNTQLSQVISQQTKQKEHLSQIIANQEEISE